MTISTSDLKTIGKTKPYLFADFCELLVLAGQYEELSKANLHDLLNEDYQPDLDESDPDDDTPAIKSGNAGFERETHYVQNCFDHLDYRQAALKNLYPFNFHKDLLKLKTDLSLGQVLYLFLLCCSQLGRFNKSDGIRQRCAKTFTSLCAEALKCLLVPTAKVYIFDANSDDRKNIFGTDKRTALIKLVNDYLYETALEEEILKEDSSGDFGIDIVGIYPFPNDPASGRFAILGQCAAQKEGWEDKTLEASALALRSLIHFNHDPLNFVFIPLLFRGIDGKWYKPSPLGGCVVVDRLRLLNCLCGHALPTVLETEIFERIAQLGFEKVAKSSAKTAITT